MRFKRLHGAKVNRFNTSFNLKKHDAQKYTKLLNSDFYLLDFSHLRPFRIQIKSIDQGGPSLRQNIAFYHSTAEFVLLQMIFNDF